jgi:cytochrome c biogenesis protein CcdA
MDNADRQTLKMKFAKLTVVLNGVFLFAAISILAIAGLIPVYRIAIAVIFGIASIALAVYFVGAYRRDKAWLASGPDDKPDKKAAGGQKKADNVTEAAASEAVSGDATKPDT